METCNLIQYEAGKVNVPELVNKILSDENVSKYVIFAQTDVIENAYDINNLINQYVAFLDKWNMPFGYYSYYGRFNRVLPTISNIPNPLYIFNINGNKVDVTNQFAIGFLIINTEMLKANNILLDETMTEIFYLQDLAEKCYQKNLWKSNCFFFDIHDSWKMFKSQKNEGHQIDVKKFTEEKTRYTEKKPEYKPIGFFIEELKKLYSNVVKENLQQIEEK